jgi:predicted transcriptional regulator
MKNVTLTIRVETELKNKVFELAKKERRSIADQTAYLMEMGLKALEARSGPMYADRSPAPMGAALAEEALNG